MLKINQVSCVLNNKKILDNVSLSVRPGQLVVLLGASGVGKSTLLRIIGGLQASTQGTVLLDGKPLTHQECGMVFQNFNLFENCTAQENIALVLEQVLKKSKAEAVQHARQLLQEFGLLEHAGHYPSQLSGGQKQRLALARTLALQPKVICLDEPTSALDPRLTKTVADTIKRLQEKGLMVIVTTHDLGLLQQLKGTICLMHDGRIVEMVASDDFYANRDKYPELEAFVSGSVI